nr:glycine-rich cell wall structural protein 1.0-like [Aegilops tauschii subsp. strangulata]
MGAGDGFGRDPIGRTPRGTVAVEASKAGRSPEGDAGGRAAGRRRSGAAGHRGVAVVEPDGRDEARAPGRGRAAVYGEAATGNGSGAMAIQRRRDERGEAASEHGLGRAVTGEEGRGGGRWPRRGATEERAERPSRGRGRGEGSAHGGV